SGSPVTLEAGQLSFMIGGDPATLERVRPYLAAIGPTLTHVGAVGLAKAMKIAINQGLAVQMVAFSEAVLLAEKAGIARERAVEALLRSVLASPMLKYRGPFVLGMPAEAWFDVGMMQKDLKLALDLGRATSVPLSSVAIANELLTAARGMGLGRYDFAVVFDVLATMSGTVTRTAVVTPVAPTIWTGRPLWPPNPARSIADGERTVRSAPVSTTSVSAMPLSRAATVIGAPEPARSTVGSGPGGGAGRGC